MNARSDGELVARARQGSRDAAGELFSPALARCLAVARAVTGRRDMADDVAQDAFERAFAALHRFDRRRPFAPWLHRIVVNRSLDLLRSERRLVGPEALDRVRTSGPTTPARTAALLAAVARALAAATGRGRAALRPGLLARRDRGAARPAGGDGALAARPRPRGPARTRTGAGCRTSLRNGWSARSAISRPRAPTPTGPGAPGGARRPGRRPAGAGAAQAASPPRPRARSALVFGGVTLAATGGRLPLVGSGPGHHHAHPSPPHAAATRASSCPAAQSRSRRSAGGRAWLATSAGAALHGRPLDMLAVSPSHQRCSRGPTTR